MNEVEINIEKMNHILLILKISKKELSKAIGYSEHSITRFFYLDDKYVTLKMYNSMISFFKPVLYKYSEIIQLLENNDEKSLNNLLSSLQNNA